MVLKDAMLREGLEIVSVTEQGEWCCVVGRKASDAAEADVTGAES